MFEVGFTEIVLLMALALLVLGPEKLPGLARKIGHWTGRARSMARQLRMQLEQEVTIDELAKTSRPTSRPHRTPQPTERSPEEAFHPNPNTGPTPVNDTPATSEERSPGELHPQSDASGTPEKTASP